MFGLPEAWERADAAHARLVASDDFRNPRQLLEVRSQF